MPPATSMVTPVKVQLGKSMVFLAPSQDTVTYGMPFQLLLCELHSNQFTSMPGTVSVTGSGGIVMAVMSLTFSFKASMATSNNRKAKKPGIGSCVQEMSDKRRST